MTRKGSGDDVTCSGIIDMRRLSACSDGIREDLAAAAPIVDENVSDDDIIYIDESQPQVVTDAVSDENNDAEDSDDEQQSE